MRYIKKFFESTQDKQTLTIKNCDEVILDILKKCGSKRHKIDKGPLKVRRYNGGEQIILDKNEIRIVSTPLSIKRFKEKFQELYDNDISASPKRRSDDGWRMTNRSSIKIYLKNDKILDSIISHKNDIEDALVEMEDLGYKTTFTFGQAYEMEDDNGYYYNVSSSKTNQPKTSILISLVKETTRGNLNKFIQEENDLWVNKKILNTINSLIYRLKNMGFRTFISDYDRIFNFEICVIGKDDSFYNIIND